MEEYIGKYLLILEMGRLLKSEIPKKNIDNITTLIFKTFKQKMPHKNDSLIDNIPGKENIFMHIRKIIRIQNIF